MIAIQSLWTNGRGLRTDGDLWRGSNHFLRQAGFERVEIYVDASGEDWLRSLGCVYDRWHRLPEIPQDLSAVWSIGKLYAAAEQREPFLHVDGDVWWRQPAPVNVPFLVQSAESASHSPAGEWWDKFGFAPCAKPKNPICWNFGVFGGSEGAEIARACRDVLEFVHSHRSMFAGKLCAYWRRNIPMLVEQVWVPALLEARGIPPTPLLRVGHETKDAKRLGYFHAMGGKSDAELMHRVSTKLATLLQ